MDSVYSTMWKHKRRLVFVTGTCVTAIGLYACDVNVTEDIDRVLEQAAGPDADEIDLLHREATKLWWEIGDIDRAQQKYELLFKQRPDHAAAHFEFAQLLDMRGRYAQSVAHFERFLKLNAADSGATRYAEKVLAQHGRVTASERVADGWRATGDTAQNSLGMSFVLIPASEYVMGHTRGHADHRTEHPVLLDAYWIGTHEVTAGEFQQFLDDTGYEKRFPSMNRYSRTPAHPVTFITWNDALAFTRWLSSREGRVYRLPSEAEWEFAARGTDGRTNPWGNGAAVAQTHGNLGRFGNVTSKGAAPTLEPIGSYPVGASFFGLHDMAGNVEEWCLDYYDSEFYKKSPATNPLGPTNPKVVKRVMRGGSWRTDASTNHAIVRSAAGTTTDYDIYGFRLVCEVKPPPDE